MYTYSAYSLPTRCERRGVGMGLVYVGERRRGLVEGETLSKRICPAFLKRANRETVGPKELFWRGK